jgi:hypothetical protein
MDKKYAGLLLVLFTAIILTSGCTGTTKTPAAKPTAFVGGTDGLKISLLAGQPPTQIFENQPFLIGVQVDNKGEGNLVEISSSGAVLGVPPDPSPGPPAPDSVFGYLSLAGIDVSRSRFGTVQYLPINTSLGPVSKITNSIIPGGQTQIIFSAKAPDIVGAQAQYPLKVAALYYYSSQAIATVCLKESIYQQTISGKEICKLTGAKTVDASGAPIKVTSVEELPTGFNIMVKNSGTGYSFAVNNTNFQKTEGAINQYSEKDRVHLLSVKLGETDITSDCTQKDLFLVNNVAQVFCPATLGGAAAETVEQLVITLSYGYVTTTSTTLNVQSTGEQAGTGTSSLPSTPGEGTGSPM